MLVAEGALGVITEATLKLVPKPPAVQTILAVFDDVRKAGEAISKTLTSGILPSKMEFMDQACIQAVEDFKSAGLPVHAKALVIIELDGHPEALEVERELVLKIMKRIGATRNCDCPNGRGSCSHLAVQKTSVPCDRPIKTY